MRLPNSVKPDCSGTPAIPSPASDASYAGRRDAGDPTAYLGIGGVASTRLNRGV
jgi:hypothetical protein